VKNYLLPFWGLLYSRRELKATGGAFLRSGRFSAVEGLLDFWPFGGQRTSGCLEIMGDNGKTHEVVE